MPARLMYPIKQWHTQSHAPCKWFVLCEKREEASKSRKTHFLRRELTIIDVLLRYHPAAVCYTSAPKE